MDPKEKIACGICCFQGQAKDFTPITVSANFAALECPNCLNNDMEYFEEIQKAEKEAAK